MLFTLLCFVFYSISISNVLLCRKYTACQATTGIRLQLKLFLFALSLSCLKKLGRYTYCTIIRNFIEGMRYKATQLQLHFWSTRIKQPVGEEGHIIIYIQILIYSLEVCH